MASDGNMDMDSKEIRFRDFQLSLVSSGFFSDWPSSSEKILDGSVYGTAFFARVVDKYKRRGPSL
jgi:hypothetical protein